jgi:hypothetical protein
MKTTQGAGRYNAKGCKCGAVTSVLVVAVDYSAAARVNTLRGWLPACVVEGTVGAAYENGRVLVNCRSCGAPRWADRVLGKVSVKHVCGSKCMSSTGFVCECSCGGKNHGAGYGA